MSINKPDWIRARVSWNKNFKKIEELLDNKGLNTVCVEADCPNKSECWDKNHVTFMILGKRCTRNCRFCDVTGARSGEKVDAIEPERIAQTVKKLGMKYVVITSVTRDDLADKGAEQFVRTVRCIRELNPDTEVELLIPDFGAKINLLSKAAFSGAHVIGHNIEMPKELYPKIRPKSNYETSLNVLSILGMMKEEAGFLVKSSIVLGLGETEKDIAHTLRDLKIAGVDIVYMGQYLRPSNRHWPVKKYYTPEEFKILRQRAEKIKFHAISAGPMVRSSYRQGLT